VYFRQEIETSADKLYFQDFKAIEGNDATNYWGFQQSSAEQLIRLQSVGS
jgi:hypothetical protein